MTFISRSSLARGAGNPGKKKKKTQPITSAVAKLRKHRKCNKTSQ